MRTIIKPYFFLTGFRAERYDPKSATYLVLTNHNTDWDFFYFGLVLKKHMYFVASEHILRQGLSSFFIKTLADPIPRKKGASGAETSRLIKERLQAGDNVCMMADGNRSFSGETGYISRRTAELVKESGAGLVNLTVHGGYFVNPRWSKIKRKGPIWGHVDNEYTPEQLKSMSVDEIYEAICRDLRVDAYEDQKEKMAKYRCSKPAESLETALFMCPVCKSLHSMKSEGDTFRCLDCGYTVNFSEYGYFSSPEGEPVFTTIYDWYRAELDYLRSYLPGIRESADPLFSDKDEYLYSVTPGVGHTLVASGTMTLYPDRLAIEGDGSFSVMLSGIEKISILQTDTLLFTANGIYYEIKSEGELCCALKYLICSRLLAGKEYY